jgi:hypothetical protein
LDAGQHISALVSGVRYMLTLKFCHANMIALHDPSAALFPNADSHTLHMHTPLHTCIHHTCTHHYTYVHTTTHMHTQILSTPIYPHPHPHPHTHTHAHKTAVGVITNTYHLYSSVSLSVCPLYPIPLTSMHSVGYNSLLEC